MRSLLCCIFEHKIKLASSCGPPVIFHNSCGMRQ